MLTVRNDYRNGNKNGNENFYRNGNDNLNRKSYENGQEQDKNENWNGNVNGTEPEWKRIERERKENGFGNERIIIFIFFFE